jgi:tRNA-Thr(GGU) m(6)t(6)A37 methyltransferase TsaA
MRIEVVPVGFVETGRADGRDDEWGGVRSRIVLTDAFGPDALQGIDAFSHVEVLFHFHRVEEKKVVSGARRPRNNPDWPAVGIFAQRSKNRPNRLGSTICRVLGVEGRALLVSELDAIDGTPVLDLKPVMLEFLPREPVRQPDWVSELMLRYWSPEDGE